MSCARRPRPGFSLLPPRPDLCQECAVDHGPAEAHNQQSFHYQFHFRARHGRWPTWKDAIAHCDEDTRRLWERELRRMGAWDGWEGDTPPAPDADWIPPEPGQEPTVGTVTVVPMSEEES